MARKKKKPSKIGQSAWLITFSDMMTLMLTFFVLLVSMAQIDERRKLTVLGSIIGTFGMDKKSENVMAKKDEKVTREPGPMNELDEFELLKELLWEDARDDLRFSENKFIQILSINTDVLFASGGAALTAQGRELLGIILPVLREAELPLLLAGHTSSLRDELGTEYLDVDLENATDPSWQLSLDRVLAVYRFFLENGMDPTRIRMEAFGRYHPRYTNTTEEGRSMNRRVDIVLDKRSAEERVRLEGVLPEEVDSVRSIEAYGFEFEVDEADEAPQGLENSR